MTTDTLAPMALAIVVKATALVGVAAFLQATLFRRASAAVRHFVWTLAIAGLLALPIVMAAGPRWTVAALPDWRQVSTPRVDIASGPTATAAHVIVPDVGGVAAETEPAPATVTMPPARSVSLGGIAIAVYLAGVLVLLAQLVVERWQLRALARGAHEVSDRAWLLLLDSCADVLRLKPRVRLLRSPACMPMAFGTRQPAILIPAAAEEWTEDRRRAVLLHELAHVARHDCLVQTVAAVARAVYWCHPAAWWLCRQLRAERELACDDRVLAAGTDGSDYAEHLLEIAYAFGGRRAPALAVTMARRQQLEGRMLAALDERRHRHVPATRERLAGAVVAAAVILGVGAIVPRVQAAGDLPVTRFVDEDVTVESSAAPVVDTTGQDAPAAVREAARALHHAAAAMMQAVQDESTGTWEIRNDGADGTVNLRLSRAHWSSNRSMPMTELQGLTAAQLTGAGGPIRFQLKRDAGTFTFDGVARNGAAAGTFEFAASPEFAAELVKRGMARPTAADQFHLAYADVGIGYLDELGRQGYAKVDLPELVRAAEHGVTLTYLREMGTLGYRLGTLAPLITLRDHGVTPTYVRALSDAGYKNIPADEIRTARDHGVTPDYVSALRDAGYGGLPLADVIEARDHGVNESYIKGLAAAGIAKLPLKEVVRMRDHGVSTDYLTRMKEFGYVSAGPDALVTARDHGVTPDFVTGLRDAGYSNLSLDTLVKMRDHGVTPTYAQGLKSLGYEGVAPEDLVTLRDHGLTAERIRKANEKAGTRLTVDRLKSMAGRGEL